MPNFKPSGAGYEYIIMGYINDMRPKSQKEETEIIFSESLKFGVCQAYIEQNTAIPKLQTLLRNA